MFEALPSFLSSLSLTPRAVLALGLMTGATISMATDIQVPADQPTIQAGINAAAGGDRVLVSPGTYYEHISFENKDIDVLSTDGPTSTIIDGSKTGTVVTFPGGNKRKHRTLLHGFTITHGTASDDQDGGGATVSRKANPTIEYNIFEDNHSMYGGGAILVSGFAHVRNNTFRRNGAGSEGGAIVLGRSQGSVIDGNLFEFNEANFGGAINSQYSRPLAIKRNVMRNNTSDFNGGAILIYGGNVVITDNLIYDNRAGQAGGGLWLVAGRQHESAVVVNNTFAGSRGGELLVDASPRGLIQADNNIFLTTHGDSILQCEAGKHGTVTFSHNLAYSTSGAEIDGDCDVSGGGLLTVDPMFVGGKGGHNSHAYRLVPGSPAIDAGDDSFVQGERDLTGARRIQGAAVDLGAIEFRVD